MNHRITMIKKTILTLVKSFNKLIHIRKSFTPNYELDIYFINKIEILVSCQIVQHLLLSFDREKWNSLEKILYDISKFLYNKALNYVLYTKRSIISLLLRMILTNWFGNGAARMNDNEY